MTTATAQSVTDLLPVALRDTSRTVVALRSANPPSLQELRTQCDAQTAGLRNELHRQGHPGDVIDDALYAQCALLDEAALSGLGGAAREAWEREPLQVRVFGRNDAGEELLRRIAARLREVKPVLPLLGIFAAVLAMGFKGRYAVGDPAARTTLVRSIDERLERATGNTGAPDRSGPVVVNPLLRRRRVFSPLAWVLIACIAGGLAWLVIDRWLLSSIAGMAH
ncbi:DotU family type IV/VI secretion system protein [Paraburkholderia caballeronis]|uniref:DotU family type IV/VI secretion system protein n=1 Tax=Paraburkholderia caballeronis TaxID=416943 RepID=UPI001065EE53|nr:DotU family type IV/VI secretion system protein [Paraburkholderia caballeronis]TDV04562.1 type VI secretion system protein ImpK [Paraburkholderia caballeronis]TDV07704.1 type VI secretion system protein ImpK [Paraburkholderia caballeronis]TDV17735.1 type VI secretion system protein ImpK [Paraburkholderia caballeronis]